MAITKNKTEAVRDSGMASDSVATYFEQIVVTFRQTTVRKVL